LAILGREEKLPTVAMQFADGAVVLRASSDAGSGEEEVACKEMHGGGLTVRANVNLVLDGLRLAESEVVEMRGWGAEMIQEIREVGSEAWRYYWLPLRGGN
jgi:DNA polymerase III sliding clamp (beta) subunit (PCNA family)